MTTSSARRPVNGLAEDGNEAECSLWPVAEMTVPAGRRCPKEGVGASSLVSLSGTSREVPATQPRPPVPIGIAIARRRRPRRLSALVLLAVWTSAAGCSSASPPQLAKSPTAAVTGSSSSTEDGSAATVHPKGPGRRGVIAAAGDIGCEGRPCGAQRATGELLRRTNPRAVLALGDTQYERGALRQYVRSYDPTWGAFKRRTYPTPGDHEYATARARGYFGYFGRRAHPPRGYYSFDLAGWHVLSLNSQRSIARQTTWIRRDLRRDHHRCELAFWHEPRWSSASGGNRPLFAPWWDELYAAGVDVVLNAHEHQYERFAKLAPDGSPSPGGIREFVVGTGGAELAGFARPPDRGSERRLKEHGILVLRFSASRYAWRFIAVNSGVRDAGADACHT